MLRAVSFKVIRMSDFDLRDRYNSGRCDEDLFDEGLSADEDLVMEQILDNINKTPIGQVLKKIASLPEIRKEKVLDVRQRLNSHQYEINDRLEVALDKVLEELTT